MAYANYNYYQNEYGGVMPSSDFNRHIIKASREIDLATQDRAQTAPASMGTRLRSCACELADLYHADAKRLESSEGGTVNSVNNDGYSVSFVSAKDAEEALKVNERKALAKYLKRPVNLMPSVRWG